MRPTPDAAPAGADDARYMCFGAFTALEPCERCGRVHPAQLVERCIEFAAKDAAAGLDAELKRYLASPEAQFFAFLATRPTA